ncbi:HGGxSTG domain-containing protein [Streptomyces sp. NPDC057499]|uniref:HGGxSTG domain-containing protein n=1 Tax=Streptomyces sp. NPDC057499 TaxID=3346150 RepID=UPI00367D805F
MARTQSRCGALTQKGKRCQRLAMVGASRCDLHRGEWSSYETEKRRAKKRRK